MQTRTMNTPIGLLSITAHEQYITMLKFGKDEPSATTDESTTLDRAEAQLREYFDGTRTQFELLLKLDGTDFQRAVWQACAQIPYGTTVTYGQLAAKIGRPKAARAIGMAMHDNPIVIVVPCHRVVGASGKLTGFAGGLDVKAWLLEHELAKD